MYVFRSRNVTTLPKVMLLLTTTTVPWASSMSRAWLRVQPRLLPSLAALVEGKARTSGRQRWPSMSSGPLLVWRMMERKTRWRLYSRRRSPPCLLMVVTMLLLLWTGTMSLCQASLLECHAPWSVRDHGEASVAVGIMMVLVLWPALAGECDMKGQLNGVALHSDLAEWVDDHGHHQLSADVLGLAHAPGQGPDQDLGHVHGAVPALCQRVAPDHPPHVIMTAGDAGTTAGEIGIPSHTIWHLSVIEILMQSASALQHVLWGYNLSLKVLRICRGPCYSMDSTISICAHRGGF